MIQNPQFFIGVVEDIHDPLKLNRVRVRVFGKHTEDITLLPTENLPWCNTVMPNTSASVSGVGQTLGLVHGSWVFGTFIDPNEQEALILGSMGGESTRPYALGEGFKDPDGIYPRQSGPDTSKSTTSSRSASQKNREAQRVTDIPLASQPHLSTLSDTDKPKQEGISTPDPKEYSQPVYPYNNVTQTESGHTIEYDDTPGKERISQKHTSGTGYDIIQDGSKVEYIVGDGYTVYSKDSTVYIVGNCNLSVRGDVKHKVEGNYVLDIEGDLTYNVHGNIHTKCYGNSLTEIGGKRDTNITSTDLLKVGENQAIVVNLDQSITVHGNANNVISSDRKDFVGGNHLLNIGTRETVVNNDDEEIVLGSKRLSSVKNLKISCPEKMHINTPVAQVSGDVLAGGGGVSLITHMHRQNNGNDTGGNADTNQSIGGTGVGE